MQKSLSFDTTLYKQIQAEFYTAIVECENKHIKSVAMRELDSGLIKNYLLTNLRQNLIGHKFQSSYLPKTIFIPIVLMNPLAGSYSGFNFSAIMKSFASDDINLTKSFWVLRAIYYKGSIDRWKRWGSSEQPGDWPELDLQ